MAFYFLWNSFKFPKYDRKAMRTCFFLSFVFLLSANFFLLSFTVSLRFTECGQSNVNFHLPIPTKTLNQLKHKMSSAFDRKQSFKLDFNMKNPNKKILFNSYYPIFSFILLSAYQVSLKEFVIVGLGSQVAEKQKLFLNCVWKSDDGMIVRKGGNVRVDFPGEKHGKTYQTFIIHCSFDKLPYFNLKGNLYVWIREPEDEVRVFPEPLHLLTESDFNREFKFQIVSCISPIHDYVNKERLMEWMEYHTSIGVDRFVIYVASFDEDVLELLKSYVDDELLDVVDVSHVSKFDVWYNGQSAFMHDCKLRYQTVSKWMMFLDLDEYLSFTEPRTDMAVFLQDYQDKPYVTFGSLSWSSTLCFHVSEKRVWGIERLRFHESNVHCLDKMKKQFPDVRLCTSHWGHRKYVVNPRKSHFLRIHSVTEPRFGGLDLSTDIARVNHYHGFSSMNDSFCSKVRHRKEDFKTWKYDEDMADRAREVRMIRVLNGFEL